MSRAEPASERPGARRDDEEFHVERDPRDRTRRLRRVHTRTIPILRGVAALFLVLAAILHNAWLTDTLDWTGTLWFAVGLALYVAASTWALRRWYDPDATFDLGLAFLVVDLVPLAVTVHLTGGHQSWLFWIFLLRVSDQSTSYFRRALAFTALGTATYAAVAAVSMLGGADVSLQAQLARIIVLILGGIYISLAARTAERVRRRLSRAVRVARHSIADLRHESSELEEARSEAESASRAKSEFLSRVSHELRTPMNAILGFAQLLEMEDELTPSQRGYIDEIMDGGRHLLDIINEVLDIARVETGSLAEAMEPVSLRKAMSDVLERSQAAARKRSIALPEEPPEGSDVWVVGHARKVRQVFANLVSNAIKYNRSPGFVALTCGVDGDRVRVSVTDRGPGIPADRVESAFTPFERLGAETREIEGTGLGLAVARSLVDAMNGEIGVDTREGEGSTFWFELKLSDPPPQAEIDLEAPAEKAAGPVVLYIDDKPENTLLVQRILARRPTVKLVTAAVGLKGIEEARARRPDLILLDLELPDIAGEEVLDRLRDDPTTASIPVVVVSAEASATKVERMLADGARAYFTMPYDVVKFLATLDEILRLG